MNPYIIIGLIAAFILNSGVSGFVGWHERAIRVPAELAAQKDTDTKACDKAQAVTKGENDALQKNRDVIAHKLASYKLQHPTCVSVTSSPNLPGSGPEHAGHDGTGLSSDWLNDFAATCEGYRSTLMVCTDFVKKERELMP